MGRWGDGADESAFSVLNWPVQPCNTTHQAGVCPAHERGRAAKGRCTKLTVADPAVALRVELEREQPLLVLKRLLLARALKLGLGGLDRCSGNDVGLATAPAMPKRWVGENRIRRRGG